MRGIIAMPAPAVGPIDRIVGRSLYDLRQKLGLNPSAMATLLGVTALDLTAYEQGHKRAPAIFLLRVCQQLGVSPDTFYKDAPCDAPPAEDLLEPADIPRSWTS